MQSQRLNAHASPFQPSTSHDSPTQSDGAPSANESPDELSRAFSSTHLFDAPGAQVDRRNSWDDALRVLSHGSTLLHQIALTGDVPMLEQHLRTQPDIEARDAAGCTALHCAASMGKQYALECLLRAGAQVNAHSNTGETPLMMTADNNHLEAAIMLLNHRADPHALDNGQRSAWHRAVLNQPTPLLVMLEDLGAPLKPDGSAVLDNFSTACRENDLKRAHQIALEAVARNITSTGGQTVLHAAVLTGDPQAVRVALSAHASPNQADAMGFTPMHLAAERGLRDMVNLMMRCGGQPSIRTINGHDVAQILGAAEQAAQVPTLRAARRRPAR